MAQGIAAGYVEGGGRDIPSLDLPFRSQSQRQGYGYTTATRTDIEQGVLFVRLRESMLCLRWSESLLNLCHTPVDQFLGLGARYQGGWVYGKGTAAEFGFAQCILQGHAFAQGLQNR